MSAGDFGDAYGGAALPAPAAADNWGAPPAAPDAFRAPAGGFEAATGGLG